MKLITLQQIAELPDKEKRQLKADINHSLGEYASKMRKKIAQEQRKLESEVEND